MVCLFASSLMPSSTIEIERRNGIKSFCKPVSEILTAEFKSPAELKQAHAHLIKASSPLSVFPVHRVASVCALTPSFPYAQKIFMLLDQEEIFIWNWCLKDFAEKGSLFDVILLFHQLLRYNVCPDGFTCSLVLKACVQLHDLFHGRIIHSFVEKLGLQSNIVLQNMIVHCYASCGDINDALLLFDKMLTRDIVTWNTMVTQLSKSGDADSAYKMFIQMPERNVRSWTAMISGFVQCGKPKEAIDVFLVMERVGMSLNEVTVVAVLAACADLGELNLGRRIHEYSNKSGFGSNIHVCNTLIDMYIKCGCLEDAREVFAGIKQPSIVSWSAMIHGLAIHGQAEIALEHFFTMLRTGMMPNEITFVGLLQACSHMRLVKEGRAFFGSMIDYGIVPSIEHYGCMVDLLSRAGMLQEAHDFILQMPIRPNAAVWGAILGGCKLHKNVEMAAVAMRHLLDMDTINDGYFVVLANIFAEAKQWEYVTKLRKLMKNRGLQKTVGSSWVNVNGVVHEFVAGDEPHPQSHAMFEMWNKLLSKMKSKGYIPNTSIVLLDVDEKEKEKFLYRHSEKLALVYGLINLPTGELIRIFKNIRICEDCHTSFKLISGIVNRKIIVRDRNRFHCFEDGLCSCRDYW